MDGYRKRPEVKREFADTSSSSFIWGGGGISRTKLTALVIFGPVQGLQMDVPELRKWKFKLLSVEGELDFRTLQSSCGIHSYERCFRKERQSISHDLSMKRQPSQDGTEGLMEVR